MEALNPADQFVPAGLASLGVEADETELAVIGAAHAMFWPAIVDLLELETGEVPPEPDPDLSQPPRGDFPYQGSGKAPRET
jgi:hypothetical protein